VIEMLWIWGTAAVVAGLGYALWRLGGWVENRRYKSQKADAARLRSERAEAMRHHGSSKARKIGDGGEFEANWF